MTKSDPERILQADDVPVGCQVDDSNFCVLEDEADLGSSGVLYFEYFCRPLTFYAIFALQMAST